MRPGVISRRFFAVHVDGVFNIHWAGVDPLQREQNFLHQAGEGFFQKFLSAHKPYIHCPADLPQGGLVGRDDSVMTVHNKKARDDRKGWEKTK